MNKKASTLSAGRPSARNKSATLASLSDDAVMKRVNVQVPADQHAKLKIYATRQGKSIKDLLMEYIESLPE